MDIEEVIEEFQRYGLPDVHRRDLKLPVDVNKAITVVGLRRVGKTYLLYQTIKALLDMGESMERMFYINFEDERLSDLSGENLTKIVEIYKKRNPDFGVMYLFLDEIQNVPGWEKFVRRLIERKNARIYLTGSSSKLLSGEIATSLRGRSLTYHLFPLSFWEFLSFKGFKVGDVLTEEDRGLLKRYLEEYVQFGGFPELCCYGDILKIRTLQEYFDMVLYKDIVERYGIEKIDVMRALMRIVVKNFANRISVRKIYDILLSSGRKLSKNKMYEYFSYLEEIGFVVPLRRFSFSELQSAGSIPKFYLVDVGFPTIFGMKDMGRRMENTVAMELQRRKHYFRPTMDVSYYLYRNGEVDFVVNEGFEVKELIQVCYDPTDSLTRKREERSLLELSRRVGCKNLTVITWDYEEDGEINYVPLWKWLLTYN